MSRIRTIKPEFWTSEQVIACSSNARLLFIGLWNFCDDNGAHPASYIRLKAEVFPADNFSTPEIKNWINELVTNELINEYMINAKAYWIVTGWKRHQRIDKPTYRHPLPQSALRKIEDNSTTHQRDIDECSPMSTRAVDDDSITEWRVGSIDGESGESLGVHLTGEKAGVWSDFANGGSGDLLDLWAAVRRLTLTETIKEAIRYLGISLPQFEAHKPSNYVKPKPKNVAELDLSSPVMNYLVNDRKLTSETVRAYKIGDSGREIVFPSWRNDELIFIKFLKLDRIGDKKQMSVEANCEPCLFGWHLIPTDARTIAICEGEIDAMTLYQYGLSALSVPFGGGGGDKQRWIEYEFDRLAIFDRIYLCLDADKEGYTATRELVERLGRHRCHIVKLPYKDANECLQSNVSIETMQQCFDLASRIERPFDDISNFCQAQGGNLVIKQAYYNPPPGLYIAEDDIKQAVFYTYKNAKASAPSQITINNMIGSETYNVNKQDYALSAAQNEYLRLKHNANITNNSFEAQDYRKAIRRGKIGKYSCIKNQHNLWWVSIKPFNVEKDGSYTWINTQLIFG